MIKVDVTFDFVIKVDQVKNLRRGFPGVYIFLDEQSNPLYVGIAANLRGRVDEHLSKRTNTKRFAHHFKKVAIIYERDNLKRQLAETYLINTLKTPINRNGRYPEGLSGISVSNVPLFNQCKGLTNEGKRCKKPGHTNGFCALHGGNGQSLTSIRERHNKNFAKEQFRLATIHQSAGDL